MPPPDPTLLHPAARLAEPGEALLGVGRSGLVFRGSDAAGRPTARKVFESGPLTRAVQYALLGASNPYAWSEHAVQAALLRRRVLAVLVHHWFGRRLRVARAFAHGWDERFQAYQLVTEYSSGRPPALPHPLRPDGGGEASGLARELLPELQGRLAESGCDGLLWQAGLGNPVALANFLLEEDATGARCWVWIDLESGVPALFPISPRALFGTYLPLSWKYRRPLFDDVDATRLGAWIEAHAEALDRMEGPGTAERLVSDVAALAYHQEAWRRLPRRRAAISAQVAKGRVPRERAGFYAARPVRWWAFEARRLAAGLARRARGLVKRAWPRLAALPWRRLPGAGLAFLTSQRFRERSARDLVRLRVEQWRSRGQLSDADAELLHTRAGCEAPSDYLADFSVHLAIKPFVKAAEWLVGPALFAAGQIDEASLGLALLLGGCAARSVYTAARCLQELLRGRRAPWLALGLGALPVIGNLAFPAQIVRDSREQDDLLASFLLYDGCALIGRRLPIWGGRDTWTEHAVGHCAARFARTRSVR